MNNVGKRIRELRKLNNISANKLSKFIGVDPSTISKIENGTSKPSLDLLEKICDFFQITISDFFDGSMNTSILSEELKELLNNAKGLTPEQLELLSKFLKTLK